MITHRAGTHHKNCSKAIAVNAKGMRERLQWVVCYCPVKKCDKYTTTRGGVMVLSSLIISYYL